MIHGYELEGSRMHGSRGDPSRRGKRPHPDGVLDPSVKTYVCRVSPQQACARACSSPEEAGNSEVHSPMRLVLR